MCVRYVRYVDVCDCMYGWMDGYMDKCMHVCMYDDGDGCMCYDHDDDDNVCMILYVCILDERGKHSILLVESMKTGLCFYALTI